MNDDIEYITELYNLDNPGKFLYIYDEKDNGCPMYFDNFDETV